MSEKSQNVSEQEKEALRFLERDFNQCFEQMRHIDARIFDILKFMFTAYTVLIGVALGLYQFGLERSIDLTLPAIVALSVGLLVGLFMYWLAIRNRGYFVKIARYINEQRGFFFEYKPIGFENKSKMYVNPSYPPFFNRHSLQIWLIYLIAALNSVLSGLLLFIFKLGEYKWYFVVIGSLIILVIQCMYAISYLKSRENKSTSKAVFAKE